MRRIVLIDASIYVFRAYYAKSIAFDDRNGQAVHAVYGFLNALLAMLQQATPSHAAIAFDESLTSSFRNAIYPPYKANRAPPPPDIIHQFAYCKELAQALGIAVLRSDSFEADDLIGSASHAMRAHGFSSIIVSADKDFAQLLEPGDEIWDFARQERHDSDGIHRRYGVHPRQFVDYLALMGDAVDNIPGANGIGEKTAKALIAHFGDLDQVLARAGEIAYLTQLRGAASVAKKIAAHREQILLSRQLARIAVDAPVPDEPEALKLTRPDRAHLQKLLNQLRFGPLTRRKIDEHVERHC